MSTQNDLINYQNVIKEANSLINEQIKLWGGVVSSIQQIGKVTPSSFVNSQKQVNEALVKSTELTEKQRVADIRLQQAREKAFDNYEKKLQAEAKALEKAEQQKQMALATEQKAQALLARSENLYNKIQVKVNQLTQTYNNLAAKKELGLNLTDKELAQLNSLESRLNKYNGVLKQVDATIGKNQRNVGNYASGFNGLGNSINQITRELPAFTYSAQTGFLALSNNIPILADEIKRVSANVKEMRAQGQQVPSVMSQILTSFLSWQTALSVGVTLITVYGEEIGNFFTEMFKGSEVIDATKESLKAYVEVLKGSEFKNAYENVANVNIAFRQAREGVISKEKALKIYNDTLGDTLGETKSFEQAEKTFIAQARNYVEATLAKAQANILLEKSAQLASENFEIQTRTTQTWSEQLKGVLQTGGVFGQLWSNIVGGSKNVAADKVLSNRTKLIEKNVQSITKYNTEAERLIGEFYKLSKGLNFDTNTNTNTNTNSGSSREKAGKEALKSAKELLAAQYEANKSKLELEKESIKIADEILAKEIQIATLTRDYKKQLVDLEVKDKATASQQKIAIDNDYAKEIAKITEKMADDYGDDFTEQYKEVVKHVDDVTKAFDKTTESIDQTIQKGHEFKASLSDLDNQIEIESLGGNRGSEYWNARAKQLEDWYEDQKILHQDNAQELALIDKEYELKNIQLLNDRKNAFKQAMTEMYSSALGEMGAGSLAQFFNGQFEEIWAGADKLEEKMAAVMMAIGQIANDVFALMTERQNAYYEQQFKNLETEKDLALQFAGENTAGREAIEKQYEEKKRALQMQQARQQKQMAILQATINIAQGITSALAQAPPTSFILAGLVGVLGAVQLAKISSTPLPQFYTGTSNAPEGLALTQERGAEMITDKHGNIKTLGNNKGAQLTYLNKGDKVFTADETTQKLNELLISSGVSPIVNVSGGSGLTEEQMRNIMQDTLAKQPKNSIIFDENGIKAFTSKENRRTILKNRNVKI